ncbi:MAG: hypothetical protein JNL70_25885 [Saprospiraceae bacterium]|nr:hypothetical protein [Saprospiraceae bacterium]
MPDHSFCIIARNKSSKETVFKQSFGNWDELLFTLCPHFGVYSFEFPFKREEVLSEEAEKMFNKISYDEESLTIQEGGLRFREPNFEYSPYEWRKTFVNLQEKYFNHQTDIFTTNVHKTEIIRQIQEIRFKQMIFSKIIGAIDIAWANQLEIAFTKTDY